MLESTRPYQIRKVGFLKHKFFKDDEPFEFLTTGFADKTANKICGLLNGAWQLGQANGYLQKKFEEDK